MKLDHAFEANLYINDVDFLIEPRTKAFPKNGILNFDTAYNDKPEMQEDELEAELKKFRENRME